MKYFAILALLASSAAYATGPKDPPKPPQEPNQRQEQQQGQAQDQAQSQGQSQQQANSQSMNFQDRRQAPSVYAASIAPSANCYSGASAGVSVPGFGASGGKAILDSACVNRENIRLAYEMGLVMEADYLFCSSIGKDIPNCGKRPAPEPDPEPANCDEKVERIVEKCFAK